MSVRVGEMLAEKSAKYADKPAAFLADLMRDWDPNRDGSITKMEVRGGRWGKGTGNRE